MANGDVLKTVKDNTQRATKVKMILMDVDGTLTDGTLILLPDGEEVKSYNVLDGMGMLLAHLAGIKTGIITGKTSKPLAKRAKNLKVSELYQGILDKKKPAHAEILFRAELGGFQKSKDDDYDSMRRLVGQKKIE